MYSRRNFAKSDFNQGALFRHLSYPHYNGDRFANSDNQHLADLVEYLNDTEAFLNGIPIGGFYLLKAGNPYGSRRGTVVTRLV